MRYTRLKKQIECGTAFSSSPTFLGKEVGGLGSNGGGSGIEMKRKRGDEEDEQLRAKTWTQRRVMGSSDEYLKPRISQVRMESHTKRRDIFVLTTPETQHQQSTSSTSGKNRMPTSSPEQATGIEEYSNPEDAIPLAKLRTKRETYPYTNPRSPTSSLPIPEKVGNLRRGNERGLFDCRGGHDGLPSFADAERVGRDGSNHDNRTVQQ